MVVVPSTPLTPTKYLSGEFQDFTTAFNNYLDAQAHDARWANILGAAANFIAAITAALSALEELKAARKHGTRIA